MIPAWLLLLICLEEFALMLVLLYQQQWLDALYWLGVQLINVVLIVRMAR